MAIVLEEYNNLFYNILLNMDGEMSLFDEDLKKEGIVVRNNKRRSAMIIPLKQGKEMAEKIKKEIEEEKSKKS